MPRLHMSCSNLAQPTLAYYHHQTSLARFEPQSCNLQIQRSPTTALLNQFTKFFILECQFTIVSKKLLEKQMSKKVSKLTPFFLMPYLILYSCCDDLCTKFPQSFLKLSLLICLQHEPTLATHSQTKCWLVVMPSYQKCLVLQQGCYYVSLSVTDIQ